MPDKEAVVQFLKQQYPQFIYRVESVGEQASVLRRQTHHDDLRPGGTVSGPTLFAIADAALYIAILGEVGIIPLAVTTNMSINFLRKPSAEHDLIAHCKLIKIGKRLVVGEVTIYSEGNDAPVAHAVGTYSIPPSANQ